MERERREPDAVRARRGADTGIGGGITAADHANVTVYIEVDDLQAYLDRVETLGGKIVQGITTIPGMVTMALFADPEGNVIGLAHSETPPL